MSESGFDGSGAPGDGAADSVSDREWVHADVMREVDVSFGSVQVSAGIKGDAIRGHCMCYNQSQVGSVGGTVEGLR